MTVQQLAWRHFTKRHSLSIRPDVISFLEERLSIIPEEQIGQIIEYIANAYVKHETKAVVEVDLLEEIIRRLFRSHKAQTESVVCPRDYVHVIDAYPMLCYDPYTLEFSYKLDATLQERYQILLEKVQRHCRDHQVDWKIHPVKSIKTRDCGGAYSFGMFYKNSENEYILEDLDDMIIVSLKTDDYVISGQFVVAHGFLSDGKFVIDQFMHIPVDHKRTFLKLPGVPCPLKEIVKETETAKSMKELEKKCLDAFLVCFSEIWLDHENLLKGFDDILQSFSGRIPTAIVLLGSFRSSGMNLYHEPIRCVEEYKRLFGNLAKVIAKYPEIIANCKFIIAPGPSDPFSVPRTLPRAKFPQDIFGDFRERGIQFILASDPVRMFWFSRELVFTRDELSARMESASLTGSNDKIGTAEMVVSQGLLQPFTSETQAVSDYGQLSLCPPPDLLVIAEKDASRRDNALRDVAYGNPERFAYTHSYMAYGLGDNSIKIGTVKDPIIFD